MIRVQKRLLEFNSTKFEISHPTWLYTTVLTDYHNYNNNIRITYTVCDYSQQAMHVLYSANFLSKSCMPHASLITWYERTPQFALSEFCTAVRSSACTSVILLELRSTVTSLRTVMRHRPVGIESIIIIIILFWTSSMLFKPCYYA